MQVFLWLSAAQPSPCQCPPRTAGLQPANFHGPRKVAIPVCHPSLLLSYLGDLMVTSPSALTPPKPKGVPKDISLFKQVYLVQPWPETVRIGARGALFVKLLTGITVAVPSPATKSTPNKGGSLLPPLLKPHQVLNHHKTYSGLDYLSELSPIF